MEKLSELKKVFKKALLFLKIKSTKCHKALKLEKISQMNLIFLVA